MRCKDIVDKHCSLGLLERDFEHLLFAHGDPIVGNGKTALRAFVAG